MAVSPITGASTNVASTMSNVTNLMKNQASQASSSLMRSVQQNSQSSNLSVAHSGAAQGRNSQAYQVSLSKTSIALSGSLLPSYPGI